MSAEAVEPPGWHDFKDASPREIRAALIPEEQAEFDVSWRAAMAGAVETLDLGGVYATLENWRRHAVITESMGHGAYRRMLAQAERTMRTGELPPGSVPWSQVKAELGL